MRDITFVLILIICSLVITFGITSSWGEERPIKSIAFNWMWKETPSFCFYTDEYRANSEIAIRLWNQALGSNFRVDYRFVNFTQPTDMCNTHVFFYPDVATIEYEVLGYANCNFKHSNNQHCMLVLATNRDFDFDYNHSLTTTIMHEIGHGYGLSHPTSLSLMDICINDIMATPHCEKTLMILPYHINAIKCRYGDDGFELPNYPECKWYEEYGE